MISSETLLQWYNPLLNGLNHSLYSAIVLTVEIARRLHTSEVVSKKNERAIKTSVQCLRFLFDDN